MIFSDIFTPMAFILMIITGVLSTISDVRYKKIRNNQMIVIAVLAIILATVKALTERAFPVSQFLNVMFAIVVSWIFYKNDLWRGGDAKFFVLLSLLMPPTVYESKFIYSSVTLFIHSFIVALMFVIFPLLARLLTAPNLLFKFILNNLSLKEITDALSMIICVSWIVLPLIYLFNPVHNSVWSFLIIYAITLAIHKKLPEVLRNGFYLVLVLILGLLLRYSLLPESLGMRNLTAFIFTTIIYTFFSFLVFKVTASLDRAKQRIPFAPFLFLGSLLSYTPFLRWFMALQHLGRQ